MRRQAGTTLLVVLIMLVALTLLAITGMRMGSTSLQVVGNMQARRFVDNIAQQSVEDVMNSIVPFNSPNGAVTLRTPGGNVPAAAGTWVSLTSPAGVDVRVSARTCLATAPASGYSAVSTIAPEDNLWQYSVDVRDNFTKSTSSTVQGTKIRQLFGSCP
jgi:Tfp pilus assembly protein PilX